MKGHKKNLVVRFAAIDRIEPPAAGVLWPAPTPPLLSMTIAILRFRRTGRTGRLS